MPASDGFTLLAWSVLIIGTWCGYSLARIADALAKIVAKIEERTQ